MRKYQKLYQKEKSRYIAVTGSLNIYGNIFYSTLNVIGNP